MYLSGAQLTLHAAVHSASLSERATLMESRDALGIRFVMRCGNDSGWPNTRPTRCAAAWDDPDLGLRSRSNLTRAAPAGVGTA